MRFIQKLKAIWLVLVSYNYLVCTTKDKGTKVEFRSSYRFIPNKGMSSSIFVILTDVVKKINKEIDNQNDKDGRHREVGE